MMNIQFDSLVAFQTRDSLVDIRGFSEVCTFLY